MQQVQHPHHKVEEVIAKESRIQLQWIQQCAIQDPEGQDEQLGDDEHHSEDYS